MKYQKPICPREHELVVVRTVSIENHHKVNKDGSAAKNPISSIVGTVELENLWCSVCRETYEIEYDQKERMIIGDKIS